MAKKTCFLKNTTNELNGDLHHYDWFDSNSKILDQYGRRFWIIKKNNL
jgi:hypothetical protein